MISDDFCLLQLSRVMLGISQTFWVHSVDDFLEVSEERIVFLSGELGCEFLGLF